MYDYLYELIVIWPEIALPLEPWIFFHLRSNSTLALYSHKRATKHTFCVVRSRNLDR